MIKEFIVRSAVFAALLLMVPIRSAPSTPCHRAVLRVTPPVGMATLPGLRCYYKGNRYTLTELYTLLPNTLESGLITIIIAPCIEPVYKNHLPNHWVLNESLPARWFECTRHIDGQWTIIEKDREDVPKRIPESALVILTNPEFIRGLASPPAEPEGATLHNLPIIVFKHSVDYEEAPLLATLCGLPDIETFHQPA
jgi:hypothetical protein